MENKFQNLIDEKKYQVFIFTCPSNIPFIFASHPWFIINKLGSISRWEVLFTKNSKENSFGHLYLNFFLPFQGINIIPFYLKYFWKGKLLGQIEGEPAKRMAEFIENSPTNYPHTNEYSLIGPNSNTYAQWIIDHFPELNVKLPWSSIGKNYK